MVRRYELTGGKIVESQNEQSPILVYVNPSDGEKKYLTEELKLDEHTMNSSLDPDELSRLEFEPEQRRRDLQAAQELRRLRQLPVPRLIARPLPVQGQAGRAAGRGHPPLRGKPFVRGLSLPR